MSTTHFNDRLTEAASPSASGRLDNARTLLVELHRECPHDAQVSLHCTCTHDKFGLDREAMPFYERALEHGLDGDDQAAIDVYATNRDRSWP